MNNRREDILSKVTKVDTGDGVVVLTDMFGGTPSNLAISIMDKANIEVIAGVNLPMLVKLSNLRKEKNLKDSVIGAKDAGIKYITIASELLGK
jgi:PTS system mannose-specific IIA component